MRKWIYILISFSLGLFIGVFLFYKYWKIQDFRMFPKELVVDRDSTMCVLPSISFFRSKQIQDLINQSYPATDSDSINRRISKSVEAIGQDTNYNKVYLLEADKDNYKLLYEEGYMITRDSINLLHESRVITAEEFEKRYNRPYKHLKSRK